MKLATWNVCLGLTTKKDHVANLMRKFNLDICCLQETEIPNGFPIKELSLKDYSIEIENNDSKARVCTYIKNGIAYKRRNDLEGCNNHLVIIDLMLNKPYRLINLYRVFSPQNNVTQKDFFANQLQCITNANCKNLIISGDMNLDDSKRNDIGYHNKNLFDLLLEAFEPLNLIQLTTFYTWSRMINNVLKNSILDHVYTNNVTLIKNILPKDPIGGDHLIVTFEIEETKAIGTFEFKRNWKLYSKDKLIKKLLDVKWDNEIICVQSFWNSFEHNLVSVIDDLVPYTQTKNAPSMSLICPPFIKNLINKRKRLLKQFKLKKCPLLNEKIKDLNKDIRKHFYNKRKQNIRRKIIPGNSKSLWDAVKTAKDIELDAIPDKIYFDNIEINPANQAQAFADFFQTKVTKIVDETNVNSNVYNGIQKVVAQSENFMSMSSIEECIKSIKIKNTEGYDRIPQRILVDGLDLLLPPLTLLFEKIYKEKKVPEQWLVSKTIPIFKKGNKHDVVNYRPIANLCCTSKIFEKLIMKRIKEIESLNNVDLTNTSQHGFKTKHSTATAGLTLQSIISRALDQGHFCLMASLDLTAAFDVVNINLLIKRLKIVGLPMDVIELIKNWLSFRQCYVDVKGTCSNFYNCSSGTVQGSILGPFLYAVYVSPLFDLQKLTNFADDNFIVRWNRQIEVLIDDMQKSLEMITKWLKNSGLKVNESKTEICLFHRMDHPHIVI